MIRHSSEKVIEVHAHKFGGEGSIYVRNLLNGPQELYDKGRVFGHTTLQPGCSIGFHIHKGESETYYILNGQADYNDNGITVPIQAGDVTFCADGEGHGIANTGDMPYNK